MKQKLTEYVNISNKILAVENVAGFIGGSNTTNAGSMFISLKLPPARKLTSDEVITRLRDKLAVVTGANLYMQTAQDLLIGGRLGNAQFQYTITADDLKQLNHWAPRVMKELINVKGIADVNSDQLSHGLQEFVQVDRDTASRFGITYARD